MGTGIGRQKAESRRQKEKWERCEGAQSSPRMGFVEADARDKEERSVVAAEWAVFQEESGGCAATGNQWRSKVVIHPGHRGAENCLQEGGTSPSVRL